MATKKDVELALNGEPQTAEINIPVITNEQPEVGNDDFVIFRLVNTNRNGGTYIPNTDDAINPKTRKMERMRLLSGVDTIWMKEQKDLTKDYIDQNMRTIAFPRGHKVIRVPGWDKTLLEFLRTCRHNIGNPDRKTGSKFEFYEYNAQAEAKAAEEKELMEIEMAIKASETPVEKMRKHASLLGIQFINELGLPKPDAKIKAEYMIKAKKDPKRFKETYDSPEVEIQWLVKKAILDNKIDIHQNGNAYWAQGGSLIVRIPAGLKPLDYLTELAMNKNSVEGRTFLEQLKTVSG